MLIEPPVDWRPPWLSSDFFQKIILALGASSVRFVGGAVRDSLLGIEAADIDLATSHPPEVTQDLLSRAGFKVVPTGISHGTVTAVLDGNSCEVTTLRHDVETDGRHAKVEFTDDWKADAARRDFTINALYATADGMLFDPFGGLADLNARRVRFIGDPTERIGEDALRIYRFFRFSARYANRLDADGLSACRARAADVQNLSRERVRDEMLKLLAVPDPRAFVSAMDDIGVLPVITICRGVGGSDCSVPDTGALMQQLARETDNGQQSAAVVRLAALYPGCDRECLGHAFRLSGQQAQFVQDCREATWDIQRGKPASHVLYRYGRSVVAESLKAVSGGDRADYAAALAVWVQPVFPVTGKDLLKAGFEPGPSMGAMLGKMEQKWIESDFLLNKEELLANAIEDL